MISVIIPTYNRRDNLRLVLAALDKQTFRDFEVVVSSDGCTDNPLAILQEFDTRLNLRYCWHQHRGWGVCKARNDGARFANGTAYLFVDSDVMLNPFALEHYCNIFEANPEAIVAGRYDWLPPMDITPYDVYMNWEAILTRDLILKKEDEGIGMRGPDSRHVKNPDIFDSSKVRDKYCLSLYGGNHLVPKHVYQLLGGYDEQIKGHGFEEAEFAMRAQKVGIKAIFSDEVIGYHIHHWRDEKEVRESIIRNSEYIRDKYDLDELEIRFDRDNEPPLVYKEEAGGYV